MSMDFVSNIIWTIVNSSNHTVSNTFVCENMIIEYQVVKYHPIRTESQPRKAAARMLTTFMLQFMLYDV